MSSLDRVRRLLDSIEECGEATDFAPAINAYLYDARKLLATHEKEDALRSHQVGRLREVLNIRNKDSFVTERHHAALAKLTRLREELLAQTNRAVAMNDKNTRLREFAEEQNAITERVKHQRDTLLAALEVLASIGPDAHLHQVRDIARAAIAEENADG